MAWVFWPDICGNAVCGIPQISAGESPGRPKSIVFYTFNQDPSWNNRHGPHQAIKKMQTTVLLSVISGVLCNTISGNSAAAHAEHVVLHRHFSESSDGILFDQGTMFKSQMTTWDHYVSYRDSEGLNWVTLMFITLKQINLFG